MQLIAPEIPHRLVFSRILDVSATWNDPETLKIIKWAYDSIALQKESSVTIRPQKNVEILEFFYTFENPHEVLKFILSHDHIVVSLRESYQHIKRIFAESLVDVSLKYTLDPEEDYECLFVNIKTNLSPELALERLNRFDMEWWLDLPYNFTSLVGSTVSLV